MDEKLFSARMAEYKSAVDKYLDACLEETQCASYHKLTDSMHYSLTAGGKRLRAILVLEFWRICGGKPSNHKVFGECTATLAGDALQALAFETVLKADLPALRVLKCAQVLANAAGHEGICGGQQLDLEWEGKILSAPELEEIYLRKTSALIRAACLMGVAAAGGTKEQEGAAASYADNFGFAFQLRDDMLDVIGDEKTFGKPIGSDKAEGKVTLVDVKGLEQCQRDVEQYTARAKAAIAAWPDNSFLLELADHMVNRVK